MNSIGLRYSLRCVGLGCDFSYFDETKEQLNGLWGKYRCPHPQAGSRQGLEAAFPDRVFRGNGWSDPGSRIRCGGRGCDASCVLFGGIQERGAVPPHSCEMLSLSPTQLCESGRICWRHGAGGRAEEGGGKSWHGKDWFGGSNPSRIWISASALEDAKGP